MVFVYKVTNTHTGIKQHATLKEYLFQGYYANPTDIQPYWGNPGR